MELKQFFTEHPVVAIAFSGGVDSAYLLYAARQFAQKVAAYYVKTPFQPDFEQEDALRLARQLDVPMVILKIDVLKDPAIRENPKNRCYYCKKTIFSTILQQAKKDGFPILLDGTNASDDASDRPGMQALTELGVRSPLRECNLTKEQIRELSKEAGLFTFNKPAYACLATRIPTSTPITQDLLTATEQAESFLRELGFSDFRIRYGHGNAKLQLKESQLQLLLTHRQAIVDRLKQYYTDVLLDLEVRR